jgi:hypothetical protein
VAFVGAVVGVVVVLAAIGAGVAGRSSSSSAAKRVKIPDDLLVSSTTVPARPVDLATMILPSVEGYRVLPPASGNEAISRTELLDAAKDRRAAVELGLDNSGFVAAWRRSFLSNSRAAGAVIVLFEMKTPAGAAHYRELEVQDWIGRSNATVDTSIPTGIPDAVFLNAATPNANGNYDQVVVGSTGRVAYEVLSYSKDPKASPLSVVAIARQQNQRLT